MPSVFLSLDDEDKAFVIASIKSKIESNKEERRKIERTAKCR
uniref:Uncharacterized protein n=1 Tax=Siphoviridae sp. ctD6g5 TaxID=2826196 RepID=A0A8S5MRZ1_9CAUD|nr:MAG TPA: hypothetical protein [Siphoviridae sp. ctD6g5]